MFSGAKNVVIHGGHFTVHNHQSCHQAPNRLQRATAHSALYNSSARFDSPKCHPNTRLAVLHRLMRWALGTEDPDAAVLWLYGAAGAGKSAILQSFAETCASMNLLLATFFLSRSDSTRNHSGSLFATLAYQISCRIPQIKPDIDDIIAQDPLLFNKSLEAQAYALIVQPLWPLVISGYFSHPSAPRLIIIDALDECKNTTMQSSVLTTLSSLLLRYHMPFRFLISSRPEQVITFAFNSGSLLRIHTTISLNDELDSDQDIRVFLEDSFSELKQSHPRRRLIPHDWPPPNAIKSLVKKASGQFIYASTVAAFVSSLTAHPVRCLEVALGIAPPYHLAQMPFAELDALYSHILSAAAPEALDILAYCILAKVREVVSVEYFFQMQEGDVEMYLDGLLAVVSVSEQPSHHHDHGHHEAYNTMEIRLLHASLGDFMIDKSRSGRFFISPAEQHANYAVRFMEHILETPPPLSALGVEDPELLNIETVIHHLSMASPTPRLVDMLRKCTPVELLKFYKPTKHHLMRKLYQRDLCEYINSVRILDTPEAEELYSHQLAAYYQALRERLNTLRVPRTFILFPLAIACDEEWVASLSPCIFRDMLELLPEISDEVKYPYSAKYRSVYPHPKMEYMKTFFERPELSLHHHMAPERYLGAAEFALGVLCDHRRLAQKASLNSGDMALRRNKPWRWRQHHFRVRTTAIRKRLAKQSTRHRQEVPTLFSPTALHACATAPPSPISPVVSAFPNLHASLEVNMRRASVYRTLLGGLPALISRSAVEKDGLATFASRSFCITCLKYPRSARRARDALQRYVDAKAETELF